MLLGALIGTIIGFIVLYYVIKMAIGNALADHYKTVARFEATGKWLPGAWSRKSVPDQPIVKK